MTYNYVEGEQGTTDNGSHAKAEPVVNADTRPRGVELPADSKDQAERCTNPLPASRGTSARITVSLGKTPMIEMPKSDWQYLKSIIDPLIERASKRMNEEVAEVLERRDLTERAKRATVEDMAKRHRQIISQCFDDWGRSKIWAKCRLLVAHGILEERDLDSLTPETAHHIRSMFHDED